MIASLRATEGNDAVVRFVEELALQPVPGPRGKIQVRMEEAKSVEDTGLVHSLPFWGPNLGVLSR